MYPRYSAATIASYIIHHALRLIELGLTVGTIDCILDIDCRELDDINRLVRVYAIHVAKDHNWFADGLFNRLKAHFDKVQILQLTLRITLCTFFYKFNDVMQLETDDGIPALTRKF